MWCLRCDINPVSEILRRTSKDNIHISYYFSKLTFYKTPTWLDILKLWLFPLYLIWILAHEFFVLISTQLLHKQSKKYRMIVSAFLTFLAFTAFIPLTICFAQMMLIIEFALSPKFRASGQLTALIISILVLPIGAGLIVCVFVIAVVVGHLCSYICFIIKVIKVAIGRDYGVDRRIVF